MPRDSAIVWLNRDSRFWVHGYSGGCAVATVGRCVRIGDRVDGCRDWIRNRRISLIRTKTDRYRTPGNNRYTGTCCSVDSYIVNGPIAGPCIRIIIESDIKCCPVDVGSQVNRLFVEGIG